MINLSDPVIKKFIENLHKSIERKSKNLSVTAYEDYMTENRIIKIFCEDRNLGPRQCAAEMNARYKTDMDNEDVIRILKTNRLSYQSKRAELLNWAADTIDSFAKALETRNAKDFEDFLAMRNKIIQTRDDERYKIQERIACLMFYVKHPELDSGKDADTLEKFGNVYMKHFLYDATDFLRNICLRPKSSAKGDKKDSQSDKIELLENMLNRSDMLLKDLQDEFDARIKESHQNDLVEFFSRLNSEKYGCILDEVLNARNGARQLRKKNIQLAPEIGGLFILIEKFAQFIRDSEINPILKPGSIKDMRLDEVESCDYEGSPFLNTTEVKRVKVLSPGWIYKNKDVQISRPRLKELAE
ncbi:MAG: hypothetical protein IJL12_00890 [Selenomonadaceae bacterium]|nr:hypothetical protein [Selenomonadaceae bacterium]MBQ6130887.1 hypothetical protein [Selenomonadaceae bacterium]